MTAFKPLREIITFKGGGTPSKQIPGYWNGAIPWATVKDFVSTSLDRTQDSITEAGLRNSSANLILKGHVVIPTRMSLGKAAINTIDIAINQDLRALIPKIPLDAHYLLHAILSLKDEIVKKGSGATVKGITQEALYNLKVFVPPLDDQKRIAHLLGKVEGLIARRKQHLQQLEDLLKSVFLEMFGDPIVNPRKFPVRKLSEFYINPKEGTKCGPFGSALKKEELVDSGVSVWNMDNIGPAGRMVLPFRMWITEEKYKKLSSYSVIDGDIIISRAGTVGKMCVARMNGEAAIISTNLIRLRLGNKLRPLHVVSLMTYFKGRVGRLKTGADGAFTHMNTGILDNLEFPYPPIELQDQFTAIVEKVEIIKSHYQQSLIDLKHLYGVLSQKTFKGELDLLRVPLPTEGTEVTEDEKSEFDDRQPVEPSFELPTPEDLFALQSAEGRKTLLREWLTAWLKQLGDANFVAQSFMEAARQRLWELAEDDALDWGVAEYDELKVWVFEKIESGQLKQTRNIISFNEKRQFGNQVILRTRRSRP